MTAMGMKELIDMHVAVFGVEPVINGSDFFSGVSISERIASAIENGEPYVEAEIDEDVDI